MRDSNGGPPGVLYEFIAVSLFYWLIAASLAVSFLKNKREGWVGRMLMMEFRNSLLRCLVRRGFSIGLLLHRGRSMDGLLGGLRGGGILLLGLLLLVIRVPFPLRPFYLYLLPKY